MANNTDVLIVGAGPIGLLHAWGLKRLNPSLNIEILEKYSAYQRTHNLEMDWKQLQAVMEATHSENHRPLVELLERLKKSKNIRTSELQQIFSDLATTAGVIQTQLEVKPEDIESLLDREYPNVKLIIGADGTHSVMSKSLFGEANIVKYDYDYVLQLRYEIEGEGQPKGMATAAFYSEMGYAGLIANEYVGHTVDRKTPVTMQVMISKQDYLALKQYTSGNPLVRGAMEEGLGLPTQLNNFINRYLLKTIEDITPEGHVILPSYRISVNEAPATRAEQLVKTRGQAAVLLEGDAALGLSYFKGLNAGMQAAARFFRMTEPTILDSFRDTEQRDAELAAYQTWFLKDFSPKKINEVGEYSFWRIRSGMRYMKIKRGLLNSSHRIVEPEVNDQVLVDYFKHVTKKTANEEALDNWRDRNDEGTWKPYPHREYQIAAELGTLDHVPLSHTAKKIAKLFVDYVKPYKSKHQVAQDFKQPLVGLSNFFVGLIKIALGAGSLNSLYLADGSLTLVRGVIELITFPLAWFIKPLFRGIATLIHGGFKAIEENTNLQAIAVLGEERLQKETLDVSERAYLLGISNDLHRKFRKAIMQGQSSELEIAEFTHYQAIRRDTDTEDKQVFARYFSLFAPVSSEVVDAALIARSEIKVI